MMNVWKLMCLLGVIVLVMIAAFAFTALFQLPSQEVLRPILSIGVLLVAGYAGWGINAAFTKRHTTATGFG